jgi:SAM-dependent methyltransferase
MRAAYPRVAAPRRGCVCTRLVTMLQGLKERLPPGAYAPLSRSYIALRQLYLRSEGRLLYAGDTVACPCCGSTYRRFRTLGLDNRMCWSCGSLERDRLLWLLLDRRPQMLRPGMRILHVAPERALQPRLRSLPGVEYVAGDLDARYAEQRIDVTSLDFPDDSFDAIVCNHVLEHVPDDRRAMRELRRVLRPGGWSVLLVPPLDRPVTDEDSTLADRAERVRRFGQHDHVRRYGWDYVDRLGAAGFRVTEEKLDSEIDEEAAQRYRLHHPQLKDHLFVCR